MHRSTDRGCKTYTLKILKFFILMNLHSLLWYSLWVHSKSRQLAVGLTCAMLKGKVSVDAVLWWQLGEFWWQLGELLPLLEFWRWTTKSTLFNISLGWRWCSDDETPLWLLTSTNSNYITDLLLLLLLQSIDQSIKSIYKWINNSMNRPIDQSRINESINNQSIKT